MANSSQSREVHRIDKVYENFERPEKAFDRWVPHVRVVFEDGTTAKCVVKEDWPLLKEDEILKMQMERGVYEGKPWAKIMAVLGPADPVDVDAINAKFTEKAQPKGSGGGGGRGGDLSPERQKDIRTQACMKMAAKIVSAKIEKGHFLTTVEGDSVFVDRDAMQNFATWVDFLMVRLETGKWNPGGGEGDIPF